MEAGTVGIVIKKKRNFVEHQEDIAKSRRSSTKWKNLRAGVPRLAKTPPPGVSFFYEYRMVYEDLE